MPGLVVADQTISTHRHVEWAVALLRKQCIVNLFTGCWSPGTRAIPGSAAWYCRVTAPKGAVAVVLGPACSECTQIVDCVRHRCR